MDRLRCGCCNASFGHPAGMVVEYKKPQEVDRSKIDDGLEVSSTITGYATNEVTDLDVILENGKLKKGERRKRMRGER